VEQCLEKDPAKRPTAAELLASPFFRTAKKKSYLVGTVLSEDFQSPAIAYRLLINLISEALPPLVQRQELRKRPSSTSHNTLDSWDFSLSLSLSVKKSLSLSGSSLSHPDDLPHTTDPVFELDEDRSSEKGQLQDDSEKSEDSSSGPATPAPGTPFLAGSPTKVEIANQVPVPPVAVAGSDHNPPSPITIPISTRVAHTRSTSRSVPETPIGLNNAPVTVPQSVPPEKTSHGSKLWNKLARPGSSRGKKLNAALDKTGALVQVMSAGFSSKSHKA